jgi:hypothetical protein
MPDHRVFVFRNWKASEREEDSPPDHLRVHMNPRDAVELAEHLLKMARSSAVVSGDFFEGDVFVTLIGMMEDGA